MSDESELERGGTYAGLQKHLGLLPWRDSWPAFAATLRPLIGTDRPSAVATFLGHGITAQTVRDWRLGKAGIPAWAIAETRQCIALWQANTIDRVSPGPGRTGDIQRKKKAPPV